MPVSDIFTGVYSVVGILAALAQRERTGKGGYVDTALVDSTVGVLANQGMNYLASGKVPERIGNAHPNIVPYQVFPVADGYIIIATGNDSQYVKLCGVLGAPELAKDPSYIDNKARLANRAELVGKLTALTMKFKMQDLADKLEAVGVPAGPINNLELHRQRRELADQLRAVGEPCFVVDIARLLRRAPARRARRTA